MGSRHHHLPHIRAPPCTLPGATTAEATKGPREVPGASSAQEQTPNTASEGPGLGWAPGWIPRSGQRWGPGRLVLLLHAAASVLGPQAADLPTWEGPWAWSKPRTGVSETTSQRLPAARPITGSCPDEGGGQRAGMGIIWVPVGPQLGGSREPGWHRFRKSKGRGLGPAGVGVPACMPASRLSRLTLCDPMDCSPPGSSVHGILQARVLECVAISFFRGSSGPRN